MGLFGSDTHTMRNFGGMMGRPASAVSLDADGNPQGTVEPAKEGDPFGSSAPNGGTAGFGQSEGEPEFGHEGESDFGQDSGEGGSTFEFGQSDDPYPMRHEEADPYPDSAMRGMESSSVASGVQSDTQKVVACEPGFTFLDNGCEGFTAECSTDMATPSYIGDTQMLLAYLHTTERKYKVTMPIKACGLDPIIFEHTERVSLGEDGEGTDNEVPENAFILSVGEQRVLYELAKVDGELYLSCISECLDKDYLQSIIREATVSMMESGAYIFYMVGLREMALQDGEETARLLRTLRLNTFEMSTLCAYMEGFGCEPQFQIRDGRQCIYFRKQS